MSPKTIQAEALVVGEELELRRLPQTGVLSREPLSVTVEGGGTAVLFRFGVVVLFDVAAPAGATFLAGLRPFVKSPFDQFEKQALRIRARPLRRLRRRRDGVMVIEVNDNPSVEYGVEDSVLGEALYDRIMLEFPNRSESGRGTAATAANGARWRTPRTNTEQPSDQTR